MCALLESHSSAICNLYYVFLKYKAVNSIFQYRCTELLCQASVLENQQSKLQRPVLYTAGLIPGRVKLQASSNGHEPSLTLHWEMPSNISTVQQITAHEIQFRPHYSPQNSSWHQSPPQYQQPPLYQTQPQYQKLPPVDSLCRDITLGRKDGLQPLRYYDLEVRAISMDGAGPWTAIIAYFRKLCIMLIASLIPTLLQVSMYICN